MKNFICLVLIFISIGIKAQTYSITGTVKDDKGALSGATVFLTNTKKATSTDASGRFMLNGLQPGSYEVVINMIGFISDKQSIKLEEKSLDIAFKLKESNTMLRTVTIKGKAIKQDPQDLRIFTSSFLGFSGNAPQCKILNPEVLSFKKNNKTEMLEAKADDFLVIQNDALGYKLKYLLTKFQYQFRSAICYFEGDPYFEEMKGTDEEQKQWEKNRIAAYLGSCRHYFKAVMAGNSRAQGFYTYEYRQKLSAKESPLRRLIDVDSEMVAVNKNFKVMLARQTVLKKDTIRSTLHIYYLNQISQIKQFVDTITVDKRGVITPGNGFYFNGYWASQRIADLTPLDYFVDPLEEKK
ncbi:carboxypeptidase-like regulatory domain-containing protein [Mucilaginibacter sp.]|uniref:carboxypeptidase-like regulatory domain-containing protein n=1 Tax=Mucilaginibacter sp. TaxID=1882438 RepID=UPI002605EAE9|nr:carboxypeptidase-like regulatory domain-containing protein [Mucilaginibacter sp.]MDB4924008.1 hypothetical protein [Mucilaginibacter sp.]